MATTAHPEPSQASGHRPTGRSGLLDFLGYYAEGHAPLWKAFWLWGVVLSWILFGAFAGLANLIGLNWGLFLLATIVMVPYSAWILVSVWLCADNVTNVLWSYVARFLTVIWALNIGVAAGLLLLEIALP